MREVKNDKEEGKDKSKETYTRVFVSNPHVISIGLRLSTRNEQEEEKRKGGTQEAEGVDTGEVRLCVLGVVHVW